MNKQGCECSGIEWVVEWFCSQCDGDWEHENQIKLSTVDNPGWSLVIDLCGTSLDGVEIEWRLMEVSDSDWIGYSVRGTYLKHLAI